MGRRKECNERQGRQRLFDDECFRNAWEFLIKSPQWENKSPRAILWHLNRLTEFPTGFATFLVDRAVIFDLPFIVQDNCIQDLLANWEYWERKRADEVAVRTFVPPTVEEVSAFCRETGYTIDPAKFVRYYEKRGWRNNYGQLLTAWQANVVTWNFNKKRYEGD